MPVLLETVLSTENNNATEPIYNFEPYRWNNNLKSEYFNNLKNSSSITWSEGSVDMIRYLPT